jgi:hypothetical protein
MIFRAIHPRASGYFPESQQDWGDDGVDHLKTGGAPILDGRDPGGEDDVLDICRGQG